MRKKNFLWTMAAALAFVSCSQDELLENPTVLEQNAIAFSSYLGDNAQGRAVIMDKALLGVEGFGVNAWYTPNGEELSTTEAPDFMQNTKVTYNKDKDRWEYSPVKYWPNNTGDKVSFFAYGPYAKGGNANNIVLEGTDITFTVANEVKNQVDLIYNIAPTTNLEKPAVNSTVNFTFAHALARIAFTVEAAVDEVTNGNNLLDGNTRINVKKVALVADTDTDPLNPTGPFYESNTFSLVDGSWDEPAADAATKGFVFNATDHFYHTVKDVDAETEEQIDVMQLTRFNASEPQRLLNDSSYLMVIPQEATTFKIYIEYDVISEGNDNDGNGNYDGSAITNKITSAEPLTVDFIQGKAYNFNLVLGMTSVKFEVDAVTDWDENTEEEEVWLPNNESEIIPAMSGKGTAEDPYLIWSAEQLKTAADNINEYNMEIPEGGEVTWPAASYKLMKDIDLSTVCSEELGTWIPIDRLEGGFDGNNKTIKNLYIYDGGKSNYACGIGFFGDHQPENGAKIENLHIEGNITATGTNKCIGGIVGRLNYNAEDNPTSIENCTFKGSISIIADDGTYPNSIGGIVGENADANIINCHTLPGSNIEGNYRTGGIAGCSDGNIIGCSNAADVYGERVGGIVGLFESYSKYTMYIVGCYNTGNIRSSVNYREVGGITCGYGDFKIIACYNVGSVSEGSNSGGIIGYGRNDTETKSGLPYGTHVVGCYNMGAITGNVSVAAIIGNGEGRIISANYYGGTTTQEGIDGISAFDASDYTSAMNVMNKEISSYVDDTTGENPAALYPVYLPLDVEKYINTWQYTTEGATAEMPLRLINPTLGIQ